MKKVPEIRGVTMVYGAINEKGERWYTQMCKVFDAIKDRQINYNWLITDMDGVPEKINERCNGKDYCWLTGEELTNIVRADDSQWVWAVLSGFDKGIALPEILRYPKPYADGYTGFWKNPPSIQHPLAAIEMVPWDSSLTLLFSKQKHIVDDFLAFFPLSENLLEYNAK